MKKLLLLLPALFAALLGYSYPQVKFRNYNTTAVNIEVNYSGCSNDKFAVPAGGTASPSASRGECLITWISCTGAANYTSSGTSYSQFANIFWNNRWEVHRCDDAGNPQDIAGGYPKVTIINYTDKSVRGKVSYMSAFCGDDKFTVAAGATWTASSRGVCLVTKVSNDDGIGKPYESTGTSFSMFGIYTTDNGSRIYRRDNDGNPADASSYPVVTVKNWTTQKVTGKVNYASAFCKDDSYSVDPGKTWVAASRGICLVTGLSGTLADGKTALSYSSSGTSYATFGVIAENEGQYAMHRVDKDGTALDMPSGYDKVRIKNNTRETITGTVSYGGETSFSCRPDNFSVLPGQVWMAASRGLCLVTGISTVNTKRTDENKNASCYGCYVKKATDKTYDLSYGSSGTSYSNFAIFPQKYFGIRDYRVFRVDDKGKIATGGAGYSLVTIENKTNKSVAGVITYKGCSKDYFQLDPADSLGTPDSARYRGNVFIPFNNRGLCLLDRIQARVGSTWKSWDGNNNKMGGSTSDTGEKDDMEPQMNYSKVDYSDGFSKTTGAIWAEDYVSSGTSYSTFAIASDDGTSKGEEYKVWRTDGKDLLTTPEDPGFVFINKTDWPVEVSVSVNYCMYHELIQPGKSYKTSSMGSCWFTLEAKLNPKNQAQLSTEACLLPFVMDLMEFAAGIVTGGGSVSVSLGAKAAEAGVKSGAKAIAKEIAEEAAKTFAEMAVDLAKTEITDAVEDKIMDKVVDAETAELKGQYSGYAWPFRSDTRPTYEITGGPKKVQVSPGKVVIQFTDPATKELIPLVLTKTNTVGDDMMTGSKKKSE